MTDHADGTLTEGLADLLLRPVSAEDRARARRHVLDWIGVARAAVPTDEGRILLAHVADEPAGPCTVLGGAPRGRRDAMMVNAGLGLVLELDDTHRGARLHPGPIVVPTALALAEAGGASVGAALDAVVRGYEAMIRIGESAGDDHYVHWHLTSSCGTFGAAAAAASLLGLDRTALVHALGNAGTQSSGLWQCRPERTMSKPLHAGRAAVAGADAAELAARGLTGPRAILEGPLGWYAATCPDAVPAAVLGGSATWRIHACSFKPWPGCRHVHPTIDAVVRALPELATAAAPGGAAPEVEEVEEVEVRTYGVALEFADLPEPSTPAEARFSLQHAVAAVLVSGRAGLDLFDEAVITDPGVAALRRRVRVLRDPGFDAAYPHHWGAEVIVRSRGREVRQRVEDALGDPESPLAEDALAAKTRALWSAGGGRGADGAVAAVLGTEDDAPASALLAALRD